MRSLIGRAPLNHTDLYWLLAEALRLCVAVGEEVNVPAHYTANSHL